MTHHIVQFNRVIISNENIGIVLVRIMFLLIITNLDILTHDNHVLLGDFLSSKVLLQIFTLLGILGKVHSLSWALLKLKVRVIKALLLESFLFFILGQILWKMSLPGPSCVAVLSSSFWNEFSERFLFLILVLIVWVLSLLILGHIVWKSSLPHFGLIFVRAFSFLTSWMFFNYLTVPVFLASNEGVDRKLCATAAAASKTHSKLIAWDSFEPSGPRRSPWLGFKLVIFASACIFF